MQPRRSPWLGTVPLTRCGQHEKGVGLTLPCQTWGEGAARHPTPLTYRQDPCCTLHPPPLVPQSFYLILNLALGTEGTQFTTNHNGGVPVTEEQLRLALQSAAGQAAHMEVDWVRVFGQRNP